MFLLFSRRSFLCITITYCVLVGLRYSIQHIYYTDEPARLHKTTKNVVQL